MESNQYSIHPVKILKNCPRGVQILRGQSYSSPYVIDLSLSLAPTEQYIDIHTSNKMVRTIHRVRSTDQESLLLTASRRARKKRRSRIVHMYVCACFCIGHGDVWSWSAAACKPIGLGREKATTLGIQKIER